MELEYSGKQLEIHGMQRLRVFPLRAVPTRGELRSAQDLLSREYPASA